MLSRNSQTVPIEGVATSNLKGRTPVRSLQCIVVGVGQLKKATVGVKPIVVGSSSQCDLVIEDPTVSRHHAEISVVPGGVQVRDLSSTNGIRHGSMSISEAVLPTRITLMLGSVALKIEESDRPTINPSPRQSYGKLCGDSSAMREVFGILDLASRTDASVLLQGESGTGKELAASALHEHSARAEGPFVVIDCSALHENAIDSHLFGHIRGAFTGALEARKGAFLAASGGTVFLDEIGELPLESQAKLLRVLESRTVQPLGSDKRFPIDVRIVAATHRNLNEMVDAKAFRLDLYYRMAVVHILIPPLRQRLADIPSLIRTFYRLREVDPGLIEGDNLERLCRHSWPGNGRELRNVLERAWVLSGNINTPFADLPIDVSRRQAEDGRPSFDADLPFKEAKSQWVHTFEGRYLSLLMIRHKNNISQAAKASGLSRHHLRSILRKHGMEKTST